MNTENPLQHHARFLFLLLSLTATSFASQRPNVIFIVMGFKMESNTRTKTYNGTPSLRNTGGKLEVLGGFLYTLGDKRELAPSVPAFTNTKGKIAISYRVNGRPETY